MPPALVFTAPQGAMSKSAFALLLPVPAGGAENVRSGTLDVENPLPAAVKVTPPSWPRLTAEVAVAVVPPEGAAAIVMVGPAPAAPVYPLPLAVTVIPPTSPMPEVCTVPVAVVPEEGAANVTVGAVR